MKTAFVKKLIVLFSSFIITASCFAQMSPWYVGAFSAADGSKLLITESRIYEWSAQGKGFILNYSSDSVDLSSAGGWIMVYVGDPCPFADPGQFELELTSNKTIVDGETVYKKNPNLLTSLKDEAKILDQEKEQEERMVIQAYTEFVKENKWLQGIWTMSSTYGSGQSYLFIFPQGVFYIDPSIEDGRVWQLETSVEKENSDSSRRSVTKNDTSGTIYLGGFFSIDMYSRTVKFRFSDEQLRKARL